VGCCTFATSQFDHLQGRTTLPNMDADTLRLIDANANRAREGIRTAEDHIRFSVGDCRWSSTLKSMRAQVTRAMEAAYPGRTLLDARQAVSDPQRPTSDRFEREPAAGAESSRTVAQRGLKRAQEALRVLEEFLRAEHPDTSRDISQARYQAYDCEQWLVCASGAMQIINESYVYVLLTESLCKRGLAATADAVLRGGGKLLQLREKNHSDKGLHDTASDLQKRCADRGAVLICNDRVDVALSVGAPGVHLGQDDLPIEAVRKISGHRVLVGRSTHSVDQAKDAVQELADYVAIGSMFETTTKQGRILTGVKLAEEISQLKLTLPVFAIGGIKLQNIEELKRAGVNRIAVSTAVISADDPETATRQLIDVMKR
jgi:thiamine-phosphate pyrophosphorylase